MKTIQKAQRTCGGGGGLSEGWLSRNATIMRFKFTQGITFARKKSAQVSYSSRHVPGHVALGLPGCDRGVTPWLVSAEGRQPVLASCPWKQEKTNKCQFFFKKKKKKKNKYKKKKKKKNKKSKKKKKTKNKKKKKKKKKRKKKKKEKNRGQNILKKKKRKKMKKQERR